MQASTIDLFGRAGYKITVDGRSGFSARGRRQNLRRAVWIAGSPAGTWSTASSIAACAVRLDRRERNEADVVEICELTYSRATRSRPLVLAVPDEARSTPEESGRRDHRHGAGQRTRKYASRGVKGERGIFLGHDGDQGRLPTGIVE